MRKFSHSGVKLSVLILQDTVSHHMPPETELTHKVVPYGLDLSHQFLY